MPLSFVYPAGGAFLTLLLHLLAGALGPVGFLVNLFMPLPAAYAYLRHGRQTGVTIVVVVAGALFLAGDLSIAGGYLLQFGLASICLPMLLKGGMAWDRAVGVTLLLVAVSAALVLAGYSLSRGLSVNAFVGEHVQGEVERALSFYRTAELPAERLAEIETVAQSLAEFLSVAYPGLAVVATGAMLLCTMLLLWRYNKGHYLLSGCPFHAWKAPEQLIWILIATGFAVFFGTGVLAQLALNLLTILLPIYFLQGLAVVNHLFRRKGIAPGFRVVGYLLMTLFNPLPMIVTGIGIFDLWIDFRKPRVQNN
jgi:uncharacterized protein YybS (DUF2232 family)